MTILVQDSNIKITRLELGPFGTNSYIVVCRVTGESMVVDAPGEADRILSQLDKTSPRYIVITHGHIDHTGALAELKSKLGVPVAIHPLDAASLSFRPDMELCDGDFLNVGRIEVKILHTPGHTPGSVCLLMGKYLLAGDTIFPGGPGKTGRPADFKQLIDSIMTRIFPLPDDTEIYPGHGTATLLGKEKEEFAVFSSRKHDPNLYGDVVWLSS